MLCARVEERVRDLVREAALIEGLSIQDWVASVLEAEAGFVVNEEEIE